MQGDDAAAQVVHLDLVEAALFEHHAAQRFLVRVHADRLGQVLVTGAVAGDDFAEAGQALAARELAGAIAGSGRSTAGERTAR